MTGAAAELRDRPAIAGFSLPPWRRPRSAGAAFRRTDPAPTALGGRTWTRMLAGALTALACLAPIAAEEAAPEPLQKLRALLKDGRFADAERDARALLVEVEAMKGRDSLEAGQVLDVLVEALVRGGKANDPEARGLAERAVGIKEARLGAESAEVATSLRYLGMLLLRSGDHAGARPPLERALRISEAALGPEDPDVAKILTVLASVLKAMNRYDEARPHLERALAITEKARGPDHPEVAPILSNLANLLADKGDYAAAKPLYERALAIWEKARGPDHLDVAAGLNNLAAFLRETGDLAAARPLYERALAIRERVLPPEHPDVARSLNNLANLLADMGESAAARPLMERAVAVREKGGGGRETLDLATTLNDYGALLWTSGDYAAAKIAFERALAIREKLLGPEHDDVAQTLNNLGLLLWKMGDYGGARPLYERALAVREKVRGADHPMVAICLNNLGLLLKDSEDLEGARALYERALRIYEKAFGPEHRDVALTLHNLANLLVAKGDDAGARVLYERALAIREKVLGPEHPQVASTLSSLAKLSHRKGEDAQARILLERALAIREKQLGGDHPQVAESLRALAEQLWDAGAASDALALAKRSSEIEDRRLRETLAVLPERQALELVASRERPEIVLFSGLLAAKEDRPSWLQACWDWSLRRRSVVLDELIARHRALAMRESAEAKEASERLGSARRLLAALWVRGPDEKHPDRFRASLEAARRRKEAAEADLAKLSAEFRREARVSSSSVKDVALALPRDSVLVQIVRMDVRRRGREDREAHDIALLLKPGGASGSVDLGASRRLDQLVMDWRERLQSSSGAILSGSADPAVLAPAEEAGVQLRRAVWDPIAREAGRARILFLVPDGALQQVNLAALPAPGGGYLVERAPVVHLLGAARDAIVFQERSAGEERRRGRGVLALGAPDFNASESTLAAARDPSRPGVYRGPRSACPEMRETRWSPLPESSKEASAVGALFQDREPVVVLTGAEASEARFKREAPDKRVLHLATHGFFLQRACLSALADPAAPAGERVPGHDMPARGGPPGSPAAPGRGAGRVGENPLLLSGLALAGANHAAEAALDGEDGVLTAEELAALDLDGVELAVLSACDTGRGEVEVGEGAFGMRRALEMAGVRSVVMSLWPVPDKQARSWMVRFYTSRLSGGSVIDASRRASLDLLKSLRREGRPPHPYLWAGFIAAGDWR